MTGKIVTEADFRCAEFRDAKVEDYEFDRSGNIVRKDRFVNGMHNIANIVGLDGREGFNIQDVIHRVSLLECLSEGVELAMKKAEAEAKAFRNNGGHQELAWGEFVDEVARLLAANPWREI